MKVISIQSIGDSSVLKINKINKPSIVNDDDLLIKIKAASINPIDIKLRSGLYPIKKFPAILGCDGAGTIEKTGSMVKNFKKGDAVFFFHGGFENIQGNYAEYKVISEKFVAHIPKSLSFEEAAAAPLALITAWESLFFHAKIEKGSKIFINAGAGGVGHLAIQLAKSKGAIVFTSISNRDKENFVANLGADHIYNYKELDENEIQKNILELSNNEGVDISLDSVGNDEISNLISKTKNYGQIVTLLQPSSNIDWSLARFKNLKLSFEVMLTPQLYNLKAKQIEQTNILKKCSELFDSGKLKIHVDNILPIENIAQAHEIIEDGHAIGKIVIVI